MSWIMPFPEKAITGEYGTMSDFRRKNKMQAHSGTDWAPAGSNKGKTAIPAIATGTIKLVQWSNVLGWVVVQSAMDKDKKVKYIGYCHLACNKCGINCKGNHDSNVAITLKVGDKVKAGDTVAFIGNTGSASSGAHLHATLSDRLKGVFGVTADKQDLKKAIKANAGSAKPAAAPEKPSAAPKEAVAPAPKVEAPKPVPEAPKPEPVAQHATPEIPLFHKVVAGEYLAKIALKYGVSVSKLAELNNIQNVNNIQVGQMIRLRK